LIIKRLKPAVFFLTLILLSSCQPEPKEHHAGLYVFGTIVDVTLYGVDRHKAQQALQQIETDLQYMHRAWHGWQPGPLGRINELLGLGGEFSANPSVLGLITKARELSTASDHLFNPAIGRLIQLWGFHSDDPPKGPPPSDDDIRELLAKNPRMTDIQINHVRMKSTNPALKLDLGAIAKGYALDQLMTSLQQQGVENAIINAGGDIKVIGKHGERNWRVGIRHPRTDGVIAGVDLAPGESIFTSGDYERFYKHDGHRYHHIIDGNTGYPATGVSSVTVIHPDAATADAAATAIFIAGTNDWHRIAKKMGIKYVMLIDSVGDVHINPAMRSRLEFKQPSLTFHLSEAL